MTVDTRSPQAKIFKKFVEAFETVDHDNNVLAVILAQASIKVQRKFFNLILCYISFVAEQNAHGLAAYDNDKQDFFDEVTLTHNAITRISRPRRRR